MKKCEKVGCDHAATHTVTINIPAKGVPIDLHTPIKMYLGLEMCREHCDEFGKDFKWENYTGLRDQIMGTLHMARKADADFDRTFHRMIRVDDPAYQQSLKAAAKCKFVG